MSKEEILMEMSSDFNRTAILLICSRVSFRQSRKKKIITLEKKNEATLPFFLFCYLLTVFVAQFFFLVLEKRASEIPMAPGRF